MGGNSDYPYSLPLVLEQPEAWPFDLIIKDADGYEVITQRRYAHTSSDKSVADAVEAVNFKRGERDHAAFCNAEQVARLKLVVTAVNSYASSQAEIERLRTVLEGVRANLVRLAWEENSVMIEGIDAALSGAKP